MNKHLQFFHFILICESFVQMYWENSVYSSLIKHFSRIWISSPSLFLYEHGVKYFHEEHVFKNHDEVCQHYFLKINRRWGFLKSIDLIERVECLFAVRQWKEGISKFSLAPAVAIMSTAVGNWKEWHMMVMLKPQH